MKKLTAFLLVLVLLLTGCGSKTAPEATEATAAQAETTAPIEETTAPTEETVAPTEAPTEPPVVYTNPLNGQVIDAPYTGRIFATTLSNISGAIPHRGANQADIIMEMYVNDSIVRCLALFSDITQVPSIGSIRSFRLMFTDLASHYDLLVSHAGGSPLVLEDADARGLEHMNMDHGQADTYYSRRDADRKRELGYEHSLIALGEHIPERAQELDYRTTGLEGKDYGFRFTENGTPEAGEDAGEIIITLVYGGSSKETVMTYDAEISKYVWSQYNKEMVDEADGQKEAFTNVLVIQPPIDTKYGNGANYHYADFLAGGNGYYACGGKIVPITFTCDGDQEPLKFLNADGSELQLGVGNTYIAICSTDSDISY